MLTVPINYDSKKDYFDTSEVEVVIKLVKQVKSDAVIVVNSTSRLAKKQASMRNER